MSRFKSFVACAALGVVGLASREAGANGRFPNANQLVVGPGDPSLVVVRTTFGLLVSHDRGRSFAWVCERALGVTGNRDPAIAIVGNGGIAVASESGLALSSDGCTWAPAADLGAASVIDVAAERAHPSHAVVVSTGAGGTTLAETFDGGAHFRVVGGPLPSDLLVETVDVAPSDGDRLYVSGTVVRDGRIVGAVEASRDHGATWSRTLVDLAGASSVFIGAIDPVDPSRVYLRTQTDALDALLVSSDGAASFRTVTTFAGRMLGLAVSPDGRRVAIGGSAPGVLVADRDALAFEPRARLAVGCLAWSKDGLYACGQAGANGFVVGLSVDDGATFAPRLARFGDIAGPLASCGAEQPVVRACGDDWGALATLFGADAGAPDAHAESVAAPAAAAASCAADSRGSTSSVAIAAMIACAVACARRRSRRVESRSAFATSSAASLRRRATPSTRAISRRARAAARRISSGRTTSARSSSTARAPVSSTLASAAYCASKLQRCADAKDIVRAMYAAEGLAAADVDTRVKAWTDNTACTGK